MKAKKRTVIFSLLFLSIVSACSVKKAEMSPTLGGKLYTSSWIQRSAEYKALCLQAYNIATWRVDQLAAEAARNGTSMPMAIVTDIDETILDNTPNSVYQALRGKDFNAESWSRWCEMAKADTLSGALAFFQHAADKGFVVFYLTNRTEEDRAGTIRNLQAFGFPYADQEHLIMRQETSNKEPRREALREKYNIVLLLGDNLGDFEHVFDSGDEATRNEALETYRKEFGNRFIMLPNPNYGTWEKAMNGGNPSLSAKDSVLLNTLKSH